jgi:hypothetical protein
MNMKTYLSIAMSIAASLGITTMAMAHPGGGGGHVGGGAHFGGAGHFGGGEHFGGGAHFGEGRHDYNWGGGGHRRAFLNDYWPYYGDWGYSDMSYSPSYYDESDSTVAAVQKALAREGYYHGPIDGALDLITQDAIAQYDRDHRLPVTHAIDQSLLNSLGVYNAG